MFPSGRLDTVSIYLRPLNRSRARELEALASQLLYDPITAGDVRSLVGWQVIQRQGRLRRYDLGSVEARARNLDECSCSYWENCLWTRCC